MTVPPRDPSAVLWAAMGKVELLRPPYRPISPRCGWQLLQLIMGATGCTSDEAAEAINLHTSRLGYRYLLREGVMRFEPDGAPAGPVDTELAEYGRRSVLAAHARTVRSGPTRAANTNPRLVRGNLRLAAAHKPKGNDNDKTH